ncbi:MAG: 3-ketoacyl-ACP reductase [Spirochaetota bacterium]
MSVSESPGVLVTGGSRGIGRGVAMLLAAQGYSVAVNYRSNAQAAEEAVALCRRAFAAGGLRPDGTGDAPGGIRAARTGSDTGGPRWSSPRFVAIQGDIAEAGDRRRLVREATEALGGLDALVNNAGVGPSVRADILEATEESFADLLRTNLQGPYFLTQEVVRSWLRHGDWASSPERAPRISRRVIVYITSVSSELASISRGEYCVSKAGLSMAVQLWAVRLAGEGIDVFEVRPGIIETDLTAVVKDKYDKLIAEGLVPQKRWGTPEDIGRLVRSMISGDMGFSTGSVVHSDGGLHLGTL